MVVLDAEYSLAKLFPMIPPQVNGATWHNGWVAIYKHNLSRFPMIPPQVNGATPSVDKLYQLAKKFPMIPPQVNGATLEANQNYDISFNEVSNDSAPS